MRTPLLFSAVALLALVACGKRGMESKVCQEYFAKTEECVAKASPVKAEALRQTVAVSKQGFEKNVNPIAVEKSCELMAESLAKDPDCK